MRISFLSTWILLLGLMARTAVGAPLGSAFNYNAHVSDQQGPVNGKHDVRFTLFSDELATPPETHGPITIFNVQIKNGVLSAAPDFGPGVFDGTLYWLTVDIRKQPNDPWVALGTPQAISAAPYAQHAPTSGKAKSVENGAVHGAGLQAKAVGRDKLDDKAVGHDQLDEDSISELKMKDSAVSESKLKDEAISEGKLKNGAVSRGKLAPKAVGNGQLDEDSVTAPKIANGHVVKSLNGLTDGVTLTAGSGISITPGGNTLTLVSLPDPNGWKVSGNAGAATEFLGTTDAMPLTLRVNNVVVMRYLPTTTVPNVMGGSEANFTGTAAPEGVTIAGGGGEDSPNGATDDFSTIGGGSDNQAGDNQGDPGSAAYATVSGGQGNRATGHSATVAGGRENRAEGSDSVVGGGRFNSTGVTAIDATIPGGRNNVVDGSTSFAAGYRAKARHAGAFVWADSDESDFESMDDNEFSARALGGVRFVSGLTGGAGNIAVGVQLSPGAGSWSSLSDRNAKTNIQPVQARTILEQVVRLPIANWNYKSQDASIRHIGPMAQDFAAAFNVGEGDTTITTVDADGVALAAIQGLNQKLDERTAEIQELKKTVEELKDLVGQIAGQQNGGTK